MSRIMDALHEYVEEHGEDGNFVKDPFRWLPDWHDYVPDQPSAKDRCKRCGGSGKVEGRDADNKLIVEDCTDCGGDA